MAYQRGASIDEMLAQAQELRRIVQDLDRRWDALEAEDSPDSTFSWSADTAEDRR
ncbi:MAG: hypothetical protein ACYSTL_04000 [Planctomycetota bacterium]